MSLTWFAQETETSCVAACLRMVLSSFGEIWSETELKKILGLTEKIRSIYQHYSSSS